MITDLSGILVKDVLGTLIPAYELLPDGKTYVLDRFERPVCLEGRGTVYLPLHSWHDVSVNDSIASCLLAASGEKRMARVAVADVRREFELMDLPLGSVLMSAQTSMEVWEPVPGRTFVHQSVPHGMALFCSEPEFVGIVCYDDIRLAFRLTVRASGVMPALVLDSTDVEMARTRVMDLIEVMSS